MKKFLDNFKGLNEAWAFAQIASGDFCIILGSYRAEMAYRPSPNGSGSSWGLTLLPTPGQRLGGKYTPEEKN